MNVGYENVDGKVFALFIEMIGADGETVPPVIAGEVHAEKFAEPAPVICLNCFELTVIVEEPREVVGAPLRRFYDMRRADHLGVRQNSDSL